MSRWHDNVRPSAGSMASGFSWNCGLCAIRLQKCQATTLDTLKTVFVIIQMCKVRVCNVVRLVVNTGFKYALNISWFIAVTVGHLYIWRMLEELHGYWAHMLSAGLGLIALLCISLLIIIRLVNQFNFWCSDLGLMLCYLLFPNLLGHILVQ